MGIDFFLVKSYKEPKEYAQPNVRSFYKEREYLIYNAEYLLNQVLRQINIPENHYLLSKNADKLWKELSPKGKNGTDINNYWHREKLIIHSKHPIKIIEYKGASKTGIEREVSDGSSFIFKDLFHLEHVYPIDMVIKDLVELDKNNNLNYETLSEELDKIYICRMTKEEDRRILSKYKSERPRELQEILKVVYSEIPLVE